jgi:hypothetical protein
MKGVAFLVVALGLLLAMAAPSLAHDHWGGHGGYYAPIHHHGYYGPHYGGYRPVVVVPAPVYGYATYPPVVGSVYAPVVPGPCYYGAPGVSLGFRGPRVSVGVGF